MLNNQVVFIAGAVGLLGRKLCIELLEKNGKIIISDLNLESLVDFKNELNLKFSSESSFAVSVDITSKKSILNAIKLSENAFGRIDSLVNCTYPKNKNYGKHFFDVEYSDFCENLNMHLGGYFLLSQQFAKYFSNIGKGNIINLSSIYGVIAPKFDIYKGTSMTMPVEYAAIKSAVIHLTLYIAKYLKGKNIRVNCVSPGGIFDNQPVSFLESYKEYCISKGMLNSEDIMGTLLFLLSENSKMINGQNIIIDDGFVI